MNNDRQGRSAIGGLSGQTVEHNAHNYAVVHAFSTSTGEETEYAYAYADPNSTNQSQTLPNGSEHQYAYADVNLANQSQKPAGSEYAYADVKLNEQSISGNDPVDDEEWEVSSANEDETNGWTANTVYATANDNGNGTETDQEGWKDNIIYAGDE